MSLPNLHRNTWLHIGAALLLALVAMLLIRLHYANGATPAADSVQAGRRLAEAWCSPCHAIDANGARSQTTTAPDFVAVANMPSTTELALKVFLQSSHPTMPNVILTAEQRGDLVNYILSLKRS
ncbi:cytochrome c [Bradyrhizobium sp. 83012]|uniref:Cytochrome c n=1 Tax=Bradyrhizobium aeschynomenes TaxID=2734909 RepID=A0ABX2CJE1_9BRAD|nr:cytochrome c [Bradyrhizobium aeschynomenes]NPU67875.1 cytochrome c [Bradyrhizobium aeschynomenes]NPV24037.1 cytochrome c [Bradyrhizobium aeschynomenes]